MVVEKGIDFDSLFSGKSSVSKASSDKVLSCMFLDDVLCSFRKSEKFGVMDRCMKCRHYEEFLREMDEEDEKVMDEIDRMQRYEPRG